MASLRHGSSRLGRAAVFLAGAVVLAGCGNSPAEPTPVCTYAIAPVEFTPCMRSQDLVLSVDTQAGCSWTTTSSVEWLSVLSGANGMGSDQIRSRTEDNWDLPRVGQLLVRGPAMTIPLTARVSQAGCQYGVSPAQLASPASGGSLMFDVVQQSDPISCGGPIQNACVWTAIATVPWIAVSTPMPRIGDDRVTLVVSPNLTGSERTGQVVVRSRTVQVTQPSSY